ncbi:MAG: hypothetical protein JO064_03470 [Actinobacteria bacterium]|nr:hypothetical protein [Actinomycetota bacterium]
MNPSHYTACEECGALIIRNGVHSCDADVLAAFQLALFDRELRTYLESPQGRFEQWYAATRRDAASALR